MVRKNAVKKINNFKDLEFLKNSFEEKKFYNKNIISKGIKEKETLFKKDYFSEPIIFDTSSSFKSFFTNEQVIKLIYKISNRNIRKLVWEFERIKNQETDRSLHLKFILHSICNKLLDLYGSKLISFIIDLNVLRRPTEILEIHSNIYSINLDKENLDFDTIQIRKEKKMKTMFGEMPTYTNKYIGFKISKHNNKPYMIICDSHKFLECRIDELGYLEDEFINRIRFNIFQFMDEEAELSYYGAVLNNFCSICGKELTVPESIFFGMGPICRGDYHYR